MPSTDVRRDPRRELARPGPIGLVIRVILGAASVYALVELLTKWDVFRDKNLIESDFWFVTHDLLDRWGATRRDAIKP
jgi:hypothetical protein